MKYFLLLTLFTFSAVASNLEKAREKFPREHQEIIELIENEDFLESEEYNDELKSIYFKAYQQGVQDYLKTDILKPELTLLQNILEGLEYQEDKVSALTQKKEEHEKHLISTRWIKSYEMGFSYLSFQRHIDLKGPHGNHKLINTAKAGCWGGGIQIKNNYWSLSTQGCFLIGNSNIKEKKGTPYYREGAVPLWGARITQKLAMIVSSTKAELGFSLPIIYYQQDLENPPGNFHIKKDKRLLFAPALYGRWNFKEFFFESEIGQFIGQSNTYYSLGLGFRF